MRLKFLSLAVLTLLAIVLAACDAVDRKVSSHVQNANNSATPYPDGARRITIEELENLLKEGKAFVVDVRTQESYDAGHIPGARLIPAADIANHLKELPRDKIIVMYCS